MIDLSECLALSESAVRVDRERGIIFNTKVLGWKSANGRTYERGSVTPALYEGRRVCVGHSKGDRSPLDTYGVLEGIEVRPAGVYAKQLRLLNPDGEFERRLLAAAESAPQLFGLSHTARGREKPGSGGSVIETVESVESVDLVSDPATVSSLFESRSREMKTLQEWCDDLARSRPLYVRALREMAEAGVLGPDSMMDAPPPPDDAGGGTDHEQAILDAAKACIDDTNLSPPDKIKKIRKLLKMVSQGGGGGGSDDSGSDDEPAEESRRRSGDATLREELGRLRSQARVRAAADAARVVVPVRLLEALAPDLSDAQARAVVAELKGTGTASPSSRPKSATPSGNLSGGRAAGASGSTLTEEKPPTDPARLGKWLNGR